MALTLFMWLVQAFLPVPGVPCQADPASLTRVKEWKLQSVKKLDRDGEGTAQPAASDTRYRFFRDGTFRYTITEGALVTEEYGTWTLDGSFQLIMAFNSNPALIRSYTIETLNDGELVFMKNKGRPGETTFYFLPSAN